jgi:hypothetical protein
MYIFSKKIKCLDCGGNYRAIKERGKNKYICSTYNNYRTCTRWKLNEEYLAELVNNHYYTELIKQMVITAKNKKESRPILTPAEIMNRVEQIEVSPKNQSFTIYYKDNTFTKITPFREIYWGEE